MNLKQRLLDISREATGDVAITVAGDFQPKGMTWKAAAGSAAGAALGSGVDAAGAGAVLGGMAGHYAVSAGELPPVVVLAASPTELYLMTSNNAKGIIAAKHLLLIDTLDCANLSVELKQKMAVRTAVITDESTGHEYKLEDKRILFHHMNGMLNAFIGEDDDEPEVEPADAGTAS